MSIAKKLLYLKMRMLPALFDSNDMLKYLKLSGVKCGEGVKFWRPSSTLVDVTRPCLLEIGNYVKITEGVKILTHDYSRSVLRRVYGDIVEGARKTIIGDNVFIGMNAIVLMGAHIGNDVIVGAGSVVSGNVPERSVIAGNPAKIIMTLDEFYRKRKSNEIRDAKLYIRAFYKSNGKVPKENEMSGFWPLFMPRDTAELEKYHIFTKLSGDKEEEVIEEFLKSEQAYSSLSELIKEALNEND